jgi:integrase
MRRGLGFKLRHDGRRLLDFVSFLEARSAASITISLALEWAQQPSSAQPAEWARRLRSVRGFARYRSAIDSQTEIPSSNLLPHRPGRAHHYLYTEEEIRHLLEAVLKLTPADGLRRWTYHGLFGLLAVSGLRIGEALGLKLEDVDLGEGLLTVRGAKFGKSRLVPLHLSSKRSEWGTEEYPQSGAPRAMIALARSAGCQCWAIRRLSLSAPASTGRQHKFICTLDENDIRTLPRLLRLSLLCPMAP